LQLGKGDASWARRNWANLAVASLFVLSGDLPAGCVFAILYVHDSGKIPGQHLKIQVPASLFRKGKASSDPDACNNQCESEDMKS
jgi:hypothetical protein